MYQERLMINRGETHRQQLTQSLTADLAIVGGGMAGTCGAITAARAGRRVVLVQDRPVLGGNASSEVRMWVLGASAHMGANNRFAREGGVVNEILMENLWRNPEGNALIFDTILLEKVMEEPNITLLLNTTCVEVMKDGPDRIASIKAYCSQNETWYHVTARYFCDASGDGVVGFLAGAAFRIGAESKSEFNEAFAPDESFGRLLGHTIYFYSKDTGAPVRYVPPSFALKEVDKKIPNYKMFNTSEQGAQLWWIEWGGALDTIHDTERIKWELWRIVYGVWDYIKNSGRFPDAANLTLEWVGPIPGKRESRRFEGDHILVQQDIVEARQHADAVACGGWSIDLHPAEGVYSDLAGSHHLQPKGPYQIPYRCYYSRNVANLFMAGRIISASHVAFGSTRVMATCAMGGEVVGLAAHLCCEYGGHPRDLLQPERMKRLQTLLGRVGHHIPALRLDDPADLARKATVTASSSLVLTGFPSDGPRHSLAKRDTMQMIPVPAGRVPAFTLVFDAHQAVKLDLDVFTTSDPWHHTPDVRLGGRTAQLAAGSGQVVKLDLDATVERPGYVFLKLPKTDGVEVHTTMTRVTGLRRLGFRMHEKMAARGGADYDVYEAERRPGGHDVALRIEPGLDLFRPANLLNGWQRPTSQPNAWVADPADPKPWVRLTWEAPQTLSELIVFFDGDSEHALESVLRKHPERAVVFMVKRYEILDDQGRVIASADDQHQSRARHVLAAPVVTRSLTLRILETWGAPAAVFEVRCYT